MATKRRGFGLCLLAMFIVLGAFLSACSSNDEEEQSEDTEAFTEEEVSPAVGLSSPRYPFPQHVVYAPGTITPDHGRQNDLDREVQETYDVWKSIYLKDDCGPDRYYIWTQGATGGGNRIVSTSEGHGYGMIIVTLMAGYDPQAHTLFDGLYRFFRDHPSVNSPDLMAWAHTEDCKDEEPGNTDSAVDGDMDIAYALLLADQQWGSEGAIDYRAEAIRVIDAILEHEIHPETSLIMLGDWVTPDEPYYYGGTRSSDFMPGHLRAFYKATGDTAWLDVLEASYALYENIQAQYSPETGLLPDFVQETQTSPRPADPYYLEDETDGWYYYNACRDPWRIGVDVLSSRDPRGLAILARMNAWLQGATGGDPAMIHAGYELDGSTGEDYEYIDMAFVAPFGVGAMVEAANQEWVNALWEITVEHPANEESYFDSTLKLLSVIVMSGNWLEP